MSIIEEYTAKLNNFNNAITVLKDEYSDEVVICPQCGTAKESMLEHGYKHFCSVSCLTSYSAIHTPDKEIRIEDLNWVNVEKQFHETMTEDDVYDSYFATCPYCHTRNLEQSSVEIDSSGDTIDVTFDCNSCGHDFTASVSYNVESLDIQEGVRIEKED